MLKKNYYCLVAGLPDLVFNEKKQAFTNLIFRNELKHQLNNIDFECVKLLFLAYDNKNLLNLFFKNNELFDERGNYKKEFLENEISHPKQLPNYMIDFIKGLKITEAQKLNLQIKNKLQNLYYDSILTTKNSFLQNWFLFELNVKNTLTAFNCIRYNYNLEQQLIQTSQINTVYSLLIRKQLNHELFDDELPFSEQIFRIAESNSLAIEKEKAIDKIYWEYLDEKTFFHYFSIEKILSYTIKLNIIERWFKLDAESGKALLNKLIEELKHSYTFTEEFSIQK